MNRRKEHNMLNTTYSWGTGTALTGFEPYQLDPATLVLKEDEPTRCVMETKGVDYDIPETWTFGATAISDVYKNSGVSAAAKAVTSRGVQVLVKHEAYAKITDSADLTFQKVVPLEAHLVIKAPTNDLLDADAIFEEIKRMLGGLLEQSATSARLDELIRSALRPTT
jgi:hypothetical protein